MHKRLGMVILAAMFCIVILTKPAFGAGISLQESLNQIVSYYENNRTDLNNWEVIGLAEAGVNLSIDHWNLPDWNLDPETASVGDYAKAILAIKAVGQDPTDVNGRNLCEELAKKQDLTDGHFGVWFTDHIWSVVALDAAGGNYKVSDAIAYIISNKKSDGGYAVSGDAADSDTTGFVLVALANHTEITGVSDAINEAKNCLHNNQLDTGGFSSLMGGECSESISAVIRGLVACGFGEEITSGDWTKNGKTMIDALYAFQLDDKSFSHELEGGSNRMGTYQSLLAITDLVNSGFGDYLINRSNSNNDGEEPSGQIEVTVRVEGLKDTGTILEETEVEIAAGSKLFDALKQALDKGGIDNSVNPEGEFLNTTDIDIDREIDTSDLYWMYVVNDDLNTEANPELNQDDNISVYLSYYDAEWSTAYAKLTVDKNEAKKGDIVTVTVEKSNGEWPASYVPAEGVTVHFGNQTCTADENGKAAVTIQEAGKYDVYAEKYNESGIPEIAKTAKKMVVVEEIGVTVRVEGLEDTGTILEKTEVEAVAGSKLFDALKQALDDAGISNSIDPAATWLNTDDIQANIPQELSSSLYWMYVVNDDLNTEANPELNQDDNISVYLSYYDAEWSTAYAKLAVDKNEAKKGDIVTVTVEKSNGGWPASYVPAEDVTVHFGNEACTTNAKGEAVINLPTAGTYNVYAEKYNEIGIPEIVKTNVKQVVVKESASNNTGNVDSSKTVNIAIVGKNGNLLYGPDSVQISEDDVYGLTAMSALDTTGLSWALSDSWDGLVVNIAGEKNEGMNGWMYSINGSNPSDVPMNVKVTNGSKIIFWYSTDPMSNGPKWSDLGSASGTTGSSIEEKAVEKTLNTYSDELSGLLQTKILNADKKMSQDAIKNLENELDGNTVDLDQEVGTAEALVGDTEVSMLVPENALTKTMNLIVKELSANEQPQQFALKLESSTYEFGPSGTKFEKPVTISIKLPITEDMNIENLTPAWYDEVNKKWIPVPGVIDLDAGLAVFQIDHFTKFAVINLPDRISYADVGENLSWAKDAIEILAGKGIINGTGTGFEPQKNISRAEFVQLVATALQLESEDYTNGVFSDVDSSNWFAGAVACACNNKIISGYTDRTFRPNNSISRNEIASILLRLDDSISNLDNISLTFNDVNDLPSWASTGVKYVYKQGLMQGYEDGTFRGSNPLSRAEAAVVIYNYLNFVSTIQRE